MVDESWLGRFKVPGEREQPRREKKESRGYVIFFKKQED